MGFELRTGMAYSFGGWNATNGLKAPLMESALGYSHTVRPDKSGTGLDLSFNVLGLMGGNQDVRLSSLRAAPAVGMSLPFATLRLGYTVGVGHVVSGSKSTGDSFVHGVIVDMNFPINDKILLGLGFEAIRSAGSEKEGMDIGLVGAHIMFRD